MQIVKPAVAAVIIALHIIPFYILVSVGFKDQRDFSSFWKLPDYFTLDNFKSALFNRNMDTAIMNSLFIASVSVILVALIGAMTAYPLSRVRNRMNMTLLNLVLGVMMVPSMTVIVPLYKLIVNMYGINTYWGIIAVLATYRLPTSIFLYVNFIATIPKELDEAAGIDGCSRFSVFYRIILPSLKPVTASVIILTGVSIWNDYSFQLYLLQKPDLRTITLAISSLFSEQATNLNVGAAAALMAILPPVILFLTMQRYFIKGVVDSAVK